MLIASYTSLWVIGSFLSENSVSLGVGGEWSGGLSVGMTSSEIFWAIVVKNSLNSLAISNGSSTLRLLISK